MEKPRRLCKKPRLYDPGISTKSFLALSQINEGTIPDEDAETCRIWNTELKRRGWIHRDSTTKLANFDFFPGSLIVRKINPSAIRCHGTRGVHWCADYSELLKMVRRFGLEHAPKPTRAMLGTLQPVRTDEDLVIALTDTESYVGGEENSGIEVISGPDEEAEIIPGPDEEAEIIPGPDPNVPHPQSANVTPGNNDTQSYDDSEENPGCDTISCSYPNVPHTQPQSVTVTPVSKNDPQYYKYCPECGVPSAPKGKFCGMCRTSLRMVIF